MFRLPHSEISRVAHTEYIGVKSHPSIKVDRDAKSTRVEFIRFVPQKPRLGTF